MLITTTTAITTIKASMPGIKDLGLRVQALVHVHVKMWGGVHKKEAPMQL